MEDRSYIFLNLELFRQRLARRRVFIIGLTIFIFFSGLMLGTSPAAAARWPLIILRVKRRDHPDSVCGLGAKC